VSEKRILLIGGVGLLVLAVFIMPAALRKTRHAPGSDALSMPGPRVAEPMPGMPAEAESSTAASSANAPAPSSAPPLPAVPPPPPADPNSALELGNRYYQQEKFAEAIPYFRKALEAREDPDVLASLAICLRRTGAVQEALQALDRSLKLRPDGLEARYYLGLIQQYDLADFDAAIQTFEMVLPHLPAEHATELKDDVEYMKRVRDNLLKRTAPSSEAPQGTPHP